MMSIASSPPAPTMAHSTFAATDPCVAVEALVENPTTQHWRTPALAPRAPPHALSPRAYGRSPRLPSALPLSASPGFVEPCAPDGQGQRLHSLFTPDAPMDPHASLLDQVDPASERERERRVANRMQWATAHQSRAPVRKNDHDVVDENVADDLFSQVPRKYAGSSPTNLPAMSVPEFLQSSSPPQPPALAIANPPTDVNSNMDTTSNNNNLRRNNNLNSFTLSSEPASQDITMGPCPLHNSHTDGPTLQLPVVELAPLRAQQPQPVADPMPWETPFARSPGFGRSPIPLAALSRDFRELAKEEPKQELTLDVPTLPLPDLPSQMDRMDITMHATQKPHPAVMAAALMSSSTTSELDIRVPTRKRRAAPRSQGVWDDSAPRKSQAKKPPTQPLATNADDPLRCTICGTKFARRSNLYKHLRSVHEDERKFSCDLCSFKFKRQDHLIKHKRSVHDKVRKYTCEICGIGFAEKFNRDKHSRNIHSMKRAFQCPCGAYFQDKEKMLNCLKCKKMAAF